MLTSSRPHSFTSKNSKGKSCRSPQGITTESQCLEGRRGRSCLGNFGYQSRTCVSVNIKNNLCRVCTRFVRSKHQWNWWNGRFLKISDILFCFSLLIPTLYKDRVQMLGEVALCACPVQDFFWAAILGLEQDTRRKESLIRNILLSTIGPCKLQTVILLIRWTVQFPVFCFFF